MLERQIRLLRPGGRIAVVIPEGILSNRNDRRIRDFIRRECVVKAVVRLPQDAFKMSEGAACTSVLYAVKKDPADPEASEQGDIFYARAECIGTSPSGRPIPENDLLAIREHFRRFESDEWDGIELNAEPDERMSFARAEPEPEDGLWLEPTKNRTSLLYDRLSFVVRAPRIRDRFSYTFDHPSYHRIANLLDGMNVETVALGTLCVEPYPVRGKKPAEQSSEGIPVLKVRNITGRGINLETEFAPDNDETRSTCVRSLLAKNDILITSTGEGTIGRVEIWPYDDPAVVDSHIAICRLKPDIDLSYLVELLRSEYGQIQMLRFVSGSTGQTELLIDHIKALRIPVPTPAVQQQIVEAMQIARDEGAALLDKADRLRSQWANQLAVARRDMARRLSGDT